MNAADIRTRLGVRPVINVSGTMTSLGACIVAPEAVEAVSAILASSWRSTTCSARPAPRSPGSAAPRRGS